MPCQKLSKSVHGIEVGAQGFYPMESWVNTYVKQNTSRRTSFERSRSSECNKAYKSRICTTSRAERTKTERFTKGLVRGEYHFNITSIVITSPGNQIPSYATVSNDSQNKVIIYLHTINSGLCNGDTVSCRR